MLDIGRRKGEAGLAGAWCGRHKNKIQIQISKYVIPEKIDIRVNFLNNRKFVINRNHERALVTFRSFKNVQF